MPTVSYSITITADDAVSAPGVTSSDAGVAAGSFSGFGVWAALRFVGVLSGLSGVTVTAATLRLTHNPSGPVLGNAGSGTALGRIFAAAQANAAPIVPANIPSIPRGSASTALTFAGTTTDIDVLAQLTEWMARPGWAAGNALTLIADPTTAASGNYREFYDYSTSSTNCAQLSIIYTAGGGGINATASITEANDTVAGAATVRISAAASITEAADAATGTAQVRIAASASITEASDTSTGSIAVALTASASITEADDTLSAAATIANQITATATIQEASDTAAATATVRITGQASITEAPDAVSGAAGVRITATASIAETSDKSAGVATIRITAQGSVTEASDTLSASAIGQVAIVASASIIEANDTVSGAVVLSISAQLVVNEQDDALTAIATTGLAPVYGRVTVFIVG